MPMASILVLTIAQIRTGIPTHGTKPSSAMPSVYRDPGCDGIGIAANSAIGRNTVRDKKPPMLLPPTPDLPANLLAPYQRQARPPGAEPFHSWGSIATLRT